uniref:MADS-box domain-containing protein n=1 Tax=Leersia perrieri TaxID=77586 RepID=A0A0D9X4V2_9ORYZ
MATTPAGSGEKHEVDETSTTLFERLHGELVTEAEDLAASCGADVTVMAVSPRSGEPRVSHFGGGRIVEPAAVASMGLEEVVAMEERLLQLRQLVLRRIEEEQEKAKAAAKP